MRGTLAAAAAAGIAAGCACAAVARGGEGDGAAAQVIILKLDDVTPAGAQGGAPVSPRWQRVADFVEAQGLKASFGIIGVALEQDNPAFFGWITNLNAKGNIEFWNHGYRNRKAEDKAGEFEGPLEDQRHSLRTTQRLAKEKLGLTLKAFGPHWSGTTPDTATALQDIPEITACFFNPKEAKTFVFPRVVNMENPTFVPDFEKFKAAYEKVGHDTPCLAIQGHPNTWDDARWQGFTNIVSFLKSRGGVFMTPSEYLATKGGQAK